MLLKIGSDRMDLRVIKRVSLVILLATAVCAGVIYCKNTSGGGSERRHFELSEDLQIRLANADDIIEEIHNALSAHARSFTISYKASGDSMADKDELADELINFAMYNTDSPTEGDYVRYQYGGYQLNCQKSESGAEYEYRLTIIPVYYSTLKEEQEVDEKVAEILETLSVGESSSGYEKIQAVYDYICSNVKYDYVHKNNSRYYRDSTAYAALVRNYASCQGYAVAVFRLLKELGVECRIVTGTGTNAWGEDEFHAWNEVLLDGEYYNIDATWDAGKENYDYFMLKDEEFANHTEIK
jgi:transglutaminase/protease-like cytokinesis protein 3